MRNEKSGISVEDAQEMYSKLGYRILSEISSGSFKQVFLASKDDQKYALKVLHNDKYGEEHREHLEFRSDREVRAMGNIDSPYVAKVIDYNRGGMNQLPFIVEEYLSGGSLRGATKDGVPELPQTLKWIEDILKALLACESNNVYHRDLKPENILLRENGDAVLTDFGLARPKDASTFTISGITIGTITYAPPELIQYNKENVDHTTDLFSLGIVMYEMITGVHPFIPRGEANNKAEHMLYTEAKDIMDLKPQIGKKLSYFVTRLIKRDRAKRWSSVAKAYEEFKSRI